MSISLGAFRRSLTGMEIEEGREVRRAASGRFISASFWFAALHTFRWVTHAIGFATKNFDFPHFTSLNHQQNGKEGYGR